MPIASRLLRLSLKTSTDTISENITETYNITRDNSETFKHVAMSASELAQVAQYLDLQMKRFKTA